ncbi:MAG: ABC transporter permease subunit [Hyphomicrobiales bacterium]
MRGRRARLARRRQSLAGRIIDARCGAALNTLKVSIASLVGATIIGMGVGIARLSSNLPMKRLAATYVELFRNTPQLVQIIFWYALITLLPSPKNAIRLSSAYLSNRGASIPCPAFGVCCLWMAFAIIAAAVGAGFIIFYAKRYYRKTRVRLRVLWWNTGLIIGLPFVVWLAYGAPTDIDVPVRRGFNFTGGITLSPEFLALFLGLSLYIAAFIAEIVRTGIQSVDGGQIEVARTIGLEKADIYRRIILPQALRVMLPPIAGQYVSSIKNSSLGVAIGYPEIFNITNAVVNESGHAIEAVLLMMAIYLSISISIAVILNLYNKAVQIKGY